VDVCSDSFEPKYKIDLNDGQSTLRDEQLVELLEENMVMPESAVYECSKNGISFLFLNI
jgi:hypothetical protein